MRSFLTLVSPIFWSVKHDIKGFNRSSLIKSLLYLLSASGLIYLLTGLLNSGMERLETLAPDVFIVLMVKGYSLLFMIIFSVQIVNGLVISLNAFFQSKDLETIMTSPVNRNSLFFSRLFETQLKSSWMLAIFGMPLLVSAGMQFGGGITYYALSALLFVAFASLAVNLGVFLAILIARFFSGKKVKKFLFSFGMVTMVTLITLFRVFRPERFINPELFANATLFISNMKKTSFILLPNRWISEAVFALLSGARDKAFIFSLLLVTTGYLSSILSMIAFERYHFKGWALIQDGISGKRKKRSESHLVAHLIVKITRSWPIRRVTSIINDQTRRLMRKDFLYIIRDIRSLNQLFILSSLVVVYIFSITAIPLNWENIMYARKLKYLVTFFNIGLISIIISAICSRIVYPATLQEASSLWVIKISPISSGKYIYVKFLFFLFPVLVVGEILTFFSSYFININVKVLALECATAALLSISLVSMAVMFGMNDVKRQLEVGSKEDIKTGNVLYMIFSILLILVTLGLEAVPIFIYFLEETGEFVFTGDTWLLISAMTSAILLINISVALVSLKLSVRKYIALDLS